MSCRYVVLARAVFQPRAAVGHTGISRWPGSLRDRPPFSSRYNTASPGRFPTTPWALAATVFHPLSAGGGFEGCLARTGMVHAVSVMIDTMAFADTVMRRSLISCCSGLAHRQRVSAAR